MKRRSAFQLMGAAAATAMVGAGCGGPSSSSNVLTVGMPNGPLTENNNPFSPTSTSNSLGYRWVIWEPLAQVNLLDPDGEPTPWLAKKWVWAEDYKSVELTIRTGAKWSDGKPLSAEDIAFTFNMIKDNEALNLDAVSYKDIKASGDKVTLTFDSSEFVNKGRVLGTIPMVPKHVWSKVKDPAKDPVKKPIGSGPYTLSNWSSQAITLKPNDGYWGGKPQVPQLRYTSYNDNSAQSTALGNGECQWAYVFLSNYKKVFIKKDPEHNRLWFPSGLGIHVLFINTERKPFDSVELRQAMNLVIDREAVYKQGESGLYPMVDSPTGIPRPVGDKFIAKKYADAKHKVDVAQAKKLLKGAGFTLSDGVLSDPDGKPVKLKLVDPSGWNDYLASLQIISDDLKQIGIDATVDTMTVDRWNNAMATGDFDASLHWTNTGATPWDMYAGVMDGKQYKKLGKNASWNFGRFKNDDATAALAKYANTSDDAERAKALETLQDVMVNEVPVIPLVAGPIGAEYSTKNWTGWPNEDDQYAMPQPTQPSASQILMKLKPAK
ncbi:MAG TPA: ABC transporter substrate-binding protein [Stackebrandtia sp.]|jgi:peptide/nickel transport system substrate-binding protein|uniref:ABC transporter substrate-binding protein n=1 Tax=Stackebrandtia sp. TaxID=2023065 RepID=UPI002D358963|nr:ABC transporter substrate-binding protein [Stackebrandtia sp.]HZE41580.1 ABC transporter substrate-binding protein [Stackebrandtia sp.]